MKHRIITDRINEELNAENALLESIPNSDSLKSSLEMFEESGLMGCIEGPSDLSVNYKQGFSKL